MPRLIDRTGTVQPNPWELLPRDATVETALAAASEHIIVNALLWGEHKAALKQGGKQVAVWLDSDQTVDLIAADLAELPLVALNFPGFMDGRAYSTSVLLRRHCGYSGEIRAIGDVLRDQLFYMKRCGFTMFDLKDSVKLEDAQRAFSDYSGTYASTVEEPQPLFRRVQRAGA
ncbi:MAG TPA: DUF934 domain-containing protein [Pseudomonadales bacterium]